MWRLSVSCLAFASIVLASSSLVNQPGEVLTSPRSLTAQPLLFTFVTNQAGFDTEITISNTSQDTFGTASQSGTCTLSYYGRTTGGGAAPPDQATPVIPAGKQIVFSLSQGGNGVAATPGFQGYIFANCGFALARGTARITGLTTALALSQEAQLVSLPRSGGPSYSSLLIPFVSNQGGLDTGVVISNTSVDPFGTTPGSGACTLFYYGQTTGGGGAPPAITTFSVPGGGELIFTLSSGGDYGMPATPGFQGYIMAFCNFPNAQGYAFISDVGAQHTFLSETAEVLPSSFIRDSTPHPLLFPVVSNQNGVDTTISIANTSLDFFGTNPMSGTCTLNYYGTTAGGGAAPPSQTSALVAYGDSLVFTLSGGGDHGIAATPGFQGYIVADCAFPLARGWGYTSAGPTVDGASFEPEILSVPTLPRTTGPTTLLFPAVSNTNGKDTTVTISNTSSDPLGTTAGEGTCTISYFGTGSGGGNPPSPQTSSSSIAAGGQLIFSLSKGNAAQGLAGASGFQGYLIADCGFPDARGIASTSQVAGQLVVTQSLSRDSQNNVVVSVKLSNTGGTTVRAATLTLAKIGSTNATSGVPSSPVDIPPGTSVQEAAHFPGSVGVSGARAVLSIGGTYTGGNFNFASRIILP